MSIERMRFQEASKANHYSRYSTKDTHQRTALFSTSSTINNDIYRPSSPYATAGNKNNKNDFSASMMDQMESQSNDQLDSMYNKVSVLKNLSQKINTEINSNQHISSINDSFEKMIPAVQSYGRRVGIVGHNGWLNFKGWCGFFGIVILFFFFRWIF